MWIIVDYSKDSWAHYLWQTCVNECVVQCCHKHHQPENLLKWWMTMMKCLPPLFLVCEGFGVSMMPIIKFVKSSDVDIGIFCDQRWQHHPWFMFVKRHHDVWACACHHPAFHPKIFCENVLTHRKNVSNTKSISTRKNQFLKLCVWILMDFVGNDLNGF